MFTIFIDNESHQTEGASLVRTLYETVEIIIVDLADLNAAEILSHISEAHPETTIR